MKNKTLIWIIAIIMLVLTCWSATAADYTYYKVEVTSCGGADCQFNYGFECFTGLSATGDSWGLSVSGVWDSSASWVWTTGSHGQWINISDTGGAGRPYQEPLVAGAANITTQMSSGTELQSCTLNTVTAGNWHIDQVKVWASNDNVTWTELADETITGTETTFNLTNSPPAAGSSINMSNKTYPIDDANINITTVNFNTLINSTYNGTCDLYLDDAISPPSFNFTLGVDVEINFTETVAEGTHNYTINCTNTDGGNDSSIMIYFYVDTTFPTLITNFENNSIMLNTLIGQFNFSDNLMLYSINISLDNGSSIYFNDNLNLTKFNYSMSYDVSDFSIADHWFNVIFKDGHTATSLKDDYDFSNGLFNNYAEYNFRGKYNRGSIKITQKSGSLLDTWTSEKLIDRYSFTFEPNTLASSYTFEVEADGKIDIVGKGNSKYKTWLIYEEHWLDFYPYTDLSFKRINDNKVEVTINNVDSKVKEITFNSIGDLNVVNLNYSFYNTNLSVDYLSSVVSSQNQSIILRVNKSTSFSTNATLYYNFTLISSDKTSFSNYDLYNATFITPDVSVSNDNLTFYWDIDFNITNTTINSSTYNQSIFDINIDNCTTYTTEGYNFSLRNETSNALTTGDIDGWFNIIYNEINLNYNLTWHNANNGSICIFPNTLNATISGQIEYSADGFATKTYYLVGANLDNSTDLINLFLTDDTTIVTFTVKDQNDDPVGGAYIHIAKYDFGTNSYTTSEIIKTDTDGEALGNIVQSTQWYKFFVVYNGNIELETEPVKITGTTKNFRINLLSDYFTFYDTENNITTSLTFTNATGNFAYTFLNPTGNSVTACLSVIQRTIMLDTLLNETCQTAASGTILIGITNVSDTTYIATGTISINPKFVTDVLSVSYKDGYKKWGQEGILMTFLVRITFAMIGIWNPVVAIILLLFADIGMIAMGLYYMSWETLIVYIIMAFIVMYRVNKS